VLPALAGREPARPPRVVGHGGRRPLLGRVAELPLRNGGGLVDAPGRRVVGAKREYPLCGLSSTTHRSPPTVFASRRSRHLREGREPPEPVDELGRHLASLFATMSVRHARPPDDLLDRRRSVGAHSDWGMPWRPPTCCSRASSRPIGLEPRGHRGADLRPGCSMRNVPVVHWAFRPPRNEQDAALGHTESTPTPRSAVSSPGARPLPQIRERRKPPGATRFVPTWGSAIGAPARYVRLVTSGTSRTEATDTSRGRPGGSGPISSCARLPRRVAPSARKIRSCHKTRCSSAAARPIKIDHAEGAWLYTDDGRQILDADAAVARAQLVKRNPQAHLGLPT